jgi:hypothetical protein
MGKAAVELPDPLQTPADAGKPLTSTDDLLAQLAGEEIDRLLAEVDDSAPAAGPIARPPARAAEVAPHPIDLAGSPETAPAPDPVAPTDEAPAPDVESDVAAAAAAAQPDLTEELDAFFQTAIKVPAPDEAAPAHPAIPEAPDADGGADLLETSAAERAGLAAPEVASPAAPATSASVTPRVSDPEAGDDEPLPLYLKPLEWINAPLEACPPGLRDFIGKAAIITLVNAAAVLAYVMLFRRD